MKSIKYLFILSLTILTNAAMAQSIKNYEQEWKKVDELVQKKNLPKSALAEVRKIYSMAKKDKQDAQIIKALVYITNLQQQNREDNEKLAIQEIEKEIAENKEPAVSVLKSLLASQYLNYLQRHRWQLYNRTNTVNFIKDDLATWTLEDFHKKISGLYLQSITSEKILQETKLQPFDNIIIK